jgi:hypothetical protein
LPVDVEAVVAESSTTTSAPSSRTSSTSAHPSSRMPKTQFGNIQPRVGDGHVGEGLADDGDLHAARSKIR